MSIDRLPPEWQAWLRENTARRCSAASMRAGLTGGGFDAGLADRAIAEALFASPTPRLAARPDPQASLNTIALADRRIRVIAALTRPQVLLFDNLLASDECDALIALAETRFDASTVIDDEAGTARLHPHRSSAGASFHRGETPLIATIEARLAALLRWPADHAEGLQVMRYQPGGEYRPHVDHFDPAKPGSAPHLAHGGQRVATTILYLSDVAAGGATGFPSAGFEFRPHRGAALYFADVDAEGHCDATSLHAGMPVLSGTKYIATQWLRERPYL